MPDTQKSILVTGATGRQGGSTASQLLARGHSIAILTRRPDSEPARLLAKRGAEVVQGDFNDPASIERALAGRWGVFAMQNTWEAGVELEEEQGKRFAELARKAGIEMYLYTSVGSAHRNTGIPHFENKWRIEETIRRLEFPYHAVIRPVFFMDNLLAPDMKSAIQSGKLAMALEPETVVQMLAVQDVGKYALWVFENYERLNGRAFDLAGDALTMPQAAAVLTRATGRKVEFARLPIEEIRKFSEDYAIMLEWFDRVGYDADIEGTACQAGVHPLSFPEWAGQASWD